MERSREILIVGTAALAIACAQQGANKEAGAPADVSEAAPADSPALAERSASPQDRAARDRAAPPDADSLLPPLPGYTTDDDAAPGEVEASVDHGAVPYQQVRRRIVLDEQGFTSGAVTVVTFRPESGAAEQILDHVYGDAPHRTIRVADEEMMRIETEPFAVIAWSGRDSSSHSNAARNPATSGSKTSSDRASGPWQTEDDEPPAPIFDMLPP